jgi:hypothetical protein
MCTASLAISKGQRRIGFQTRTGGQASGVRERQRLGRSVPFGERQLADHQRRGEQHRDAGEEPAQPAVRPARPNGLALRRGAAGPEELPFEVVQIRLMGFGPLQRRGEPSAPVQIGGVTPRLVPHARRLRDVTMQLASRRVVLQPRTEPRPFMQQRLVGDLGRPFGDGDEAGVGQHRHGTRRAGVAVQVELREQSPAAHDLRGFARCGEAQQDPFGCHLPVTIEAAEGVLRQPCDGSLHSASAQVVLQSEGPVSSARPQLEQGRREQGKATRLTGRVRHERIDELLLDRQARALRGQFDRPAQLLAVHRPDQDLSRREQRCQGPVPGTSSVEVRAHRDDDRGGGVRSGRCLSEGAEERGSFRIVRTRGEDLLELIDGEYPAVRRSLFAHRVSQRIQRTVARPDHAAGPPIAAWQGTRSESVEESRAQQGGLPAPRGADEGEEPAPGQVTDSLGHDLLPAEEELRVRGLESCQPLVRAHVGEAPGLRMHRPAAFQPGVVGEDRRLKPLQLGARLDPELSHQYPAGTREDLQRLGLAAGSVQGDHQLAPPPLAQRLLPDHGLSSATS